MKRRVLVVVGITVAAAMCAVMVAIVGPSACSASHRLASRPSEALFDHASVLVVESHHGAHRCQRHPVASERS
jgi:hypothetical protein